MAANEQQIKAVRLPAWLDKFIFTGHGGYYEPCRASLMHVLAWDEDDLRKYLGTYFPKTYAESRLIFSRLISQNAIKTTSLRIYDFGCGTGGQIMGMLDALQQGAPQVTDVAIHGLDGNDTALYFLEDLLEEADRHYKFTVKFRPIPITVEDFYDLDVLTGTVRHEYDIFMTFKAVCEIAGTRRFEEANPYLHLLKEFSPYIKPGGLLILEDITSRDSHTREKLPHIMDAAAAGCGLELIYRNAGLYFTVSVSHTGKTGDKSKAAWRVLRK